jgi:hypothetical protein
MPVSKWSSNLNRELRALDQYCRAKLLKDLADTNIFTPGVLKKLMKGLT